MEKKNRNRQHVAWKLARAPSHSSLNTTKNATQTFTFSHPGLRPTRQPETKDASHPPKNLLVKPRLMSCSSKLAQHLHLWRATTTLQACTIFKLVHKQQGSRIYTLTTSPYTTHPYYMYRWNASRVPRPQQKADSIKEAKPKNADTARHTQHSWHSPYHPPHHHMSLFLHSYKNKKRSVR